MSPSSPDLVCPWQWLKGTHPGLLWICHLMKTSINMCTLQLAIWLCLLDCSPPYRSPHTERPVLNQLFIHFPPCRNTPNLRSLLQGCWGLMAHISGLKHFSTWNKHGVLSFCSFLWVPFTCPPFYLNPCAVMCHSTDAWVVSLHLMSRPMVSAAEGLFSFSPKSNWTNSIVSVS